MKTPIWAAQNKQRGRQFDMPGLKCDKIISQLAWLGWPLRRSIEWNWVTSKEYIFLSGTCFSPSLMRWSETGNFLDNFLFRVIHSIQSYPDWFPLGDFSLTWFIFLHPQMFLRPFAKDNENEVESSQDIETYGEIWCNLGKTIHDYFRVTFDHFWSDQHVLGLIVSGT